MILVIVIIIVITITIITITIMIIITAYSSKILHRLTIYAFYVMVTFGLRFLKVMHLAFQALSH